METVADLLPALQRALAQGVRILDLSEVQAVDSAVLALLFEWRRRARAAGVRPIVQGTPPALRRLAQLYGIDDLLTALTKECVV